MNKIIFPLRQGMQGDAVVDLRAVLLLLLSKGILKMDDASRRSREEALRGERPENAYSETTRWLIKLFQDQNHLNASGEVDEPTANALNALLERSGAFAGASDPSLKHISEVIEKRLPVLDDIAKSAGEQTKNLASIGTDIEKQSESVTAINTRLGEQGKTLGNIERALGDQAASLKQLGTLDKLDDQLGKQTAVMDKQAATLDNIGAKLNEAIGSTSLFVPLALNAQGTEVQDLHQNLTKMGYSISKPELDERIFGAGTRESLLQFQRRQNLSPTGILDEATHTALASALKSAGLKENRLVGHILLQNGLPAANVRLRFYPRAFGDAQPAPKEIRTDEHGFYTLPLGPDGKGVNLEARAVDRAGKEVALSTTIYGAGTANRPMVNLIAPVGVQSQEPEYRRMTADLVPHIGDVKKLAIACENDERQDLTLLNRETGWDARLIALCAEVARLSQDPDFKLSPEGLYGLFRAGLPFDKQMLAQVDSEVIGETLKELGKVGIIGLQQAEIDEFKTNFKAFAAKVQLTMPAPGSKTTYGELLDAAGIGADKDKFASLYLNHIGDGAELWQRAREAKIKETSISKLQWQGKLAFLAGNSGSVTQHLMKKLTGNVVSGAQELKAPAELVKQDLYEADKWVTELQKLAHNDAEMEALIPDVYEGEDVKSRLEAYAEDLARKVRLSYPTQVVGRMIEKDEIKLGMTKGPTLKLLSSASAMGFRLGQTPVEAFIRSHASVSEGISQSDLATGKEELKKLQRVYQITPNDASMQVLLELGITSAYDLTALKENDFYEMFSDMYLKLYKKKPTEAEKRLVWRKAEQVSSMTYNIFAIAKKIETAPAVPSITGTAQQRAEAKDRLKDALKQYPTMESLFGSMDYCECEHCRSVLSPAAYLVDLLQFLEGEPQAWNNFLDSWKTRNGKNYTAEYKPPYEALTKRRPDLPYIQLTCENTNIALPYIDIVNEILEYYVAHNTLTKDAVHNTAGVTSEELLAEPQNVVAEAYKTLREDKYPLTMPFDLWLETTRRFCEYAEMPLARVLEVFCRTDKLYVGNQPYDWATIFMESLGISPDERKILSNDNPLAAWWELYGFDAAPAVDPVTHEITELKSAKALSRRLGVTYKELVEIVKTAFVNPELAKLGILYKLPASIAEVGFYLDGANQIFYNANKDLLAKNLNAVQLARLNALSKEDWQRLSDLGAFADRVSAYATEFKMLEGNVRAQLAAIPIDKILVLADPEAGASFEETTLRFANGTAANAAVFLRINLFVRLWRKLGWTMEEVDRALGTFVPRNAPFVEANYASKPLDTALIYLAHLKALDAKVLVGKPSRIKLLTLWSNIPTTGKGSLYAKLFLNPSVLKTDPIFDHPRGEYLAQAWVTAQGQGKSAEFVLVKGHLPAIQSAVGLTAAEVAEIFEDAQLSIDTAKLTLDNISLLYRYGLLAKAVKLSVHDLITLKALSGKNPFAVLDADPLADLTKDHPFTDTLRFIEIVDQVKQSGLKIQDLDLLLRWRFDPTAPNRRDLDAALLLLKSVADGVRAIRTEHAVPAEPGALTEEFLQQKLGLMLAPATVQRLLQMLRGQETLDDVTQSFFDNYLKKQKVRVANDAGFLDASDYPNLFKPLKPLKQIDPNDTPDKIEQKRKDNEAIIQENQEELQRRWKRIADVFLPALQNRLIRQLVVQMLAAETAADPALIESLVTDSRLIQITLAGLNNQPLLTAFAAAGDVGIDADFYTSTNGAAPRQKTAPRVASADTELKDTKDVDGNALPAANSARFEGYLVPRATGAHRFYIELGKTGAKAQLIFPHLPKPTFLDSTATQDNDKIGTKQGDFVELKAGVPYRFSLKLDNLNAGSARLLVQSETTPLGKLATLELYSATAFDAASRAHELLISALTLVQALGLVAREVRYILTHADQWSDVDLSNWPTTRTGDTPAEKDAAILRFKQFLQLAEYARLKREIADGKDDLIAIFEANGTGEANRLTEKVYPLIAQLTRRTDSVVQATAEALFQTPSFASDEHLHQLWDALQLVDKFGASATALRDWTKIVSPTATEEQRFDIARGIKEAIKARFDPETWQRVAQPIFDKLRRRQRDALVAHIMHKDKFTRLEQLYESFLVDPGMEPVVRTSRIRLAIASVQLFIQRCLLNLEAEVHPSAIINADQWEWMKRYRVWEANRKIFLFPENWLEPEFRDDKSHLFTELEGTLLKDDVSADMVEDAFLNYLRKLEELARLEIVAMHIETQPDFGNNTLHVFGRTFSQPHKYFYRRCSNHMWTPWEPFPVEIEGDHLAPVVWRNRLYLFWVTFKELGKAAGDNEVIDPDKTNPISMTSLSIPKLQRQVEAQLHWSEYVQGEWSTKESGGYTQPDDLKMIVPTTTEFKAQNVFVHVSVKQDPTPEEEDVENVAKAGVYIHLGGAICQSFHLVSRNAAPEKAGYPAALANLFTVDDTKHRATQYVGKNNLTVTFSQRITTEPYQSRHESEPILTTTGQFTLLPCNNTIRLGVPEGGSGKSKKVSPKLKKREQNMAEIAALMKPVFFQDAAHTLYVEPDVTERTIEEVEEWVTRTPGVNTTVPGWLRDPHWFEEHIKPIWKKPPLPDPVGPIIQFPDPESMLKGKNPIDWLVNESVGLAWKNQVIGPQGKVSVEIIPTIELSEEASVGATPLSVSAGSQVAPEAVVVLTQAWAETASPMSLSASIAIVGSGGLNMALQQSIQNSATNGKAGLGAIAGQGH